MAEEIVLYGSPSCGMVPSVRNMLEGAGASYRYLDISRDAEARRCVREINNGFESVPTLEFPDGSTLTEPTARELAKKLTSLGLQVRPPSWGRRLALLLESPAFRIAAIVLGLVGLLSQTSWLLVLSVAIFALSLVVAWWRKRLG
jgi:mycoredoxin